MIRGPIKQHGQTAGLRVSSSLFLGGALGVPLSRLKVWGPQGLNLRTLNLKSPKVLGAFLGFRDYGLEV